MDVIAGNEQCRKWWMRDGRWTKVVLLQAHPPPPTRPSIIKSTTLASHTHFTLTQINPSPLSHPSINKLQSIIKDVD